MKNSNRCMFRVGLRVPSGKDKDFLVILEGCFASEVCGKGIIIVESTLLAQIKQQTRLTREEIINWLQDSNFIKIADAWLINKIEFLDQSLGLKDISRNLIYENDFIKNCVTGEIFIVKWLQDELSYAMINDNNVLQGCNYMKYRWEIVGNLYKGHRNV